MCKPTAGAIAFRALSQREKNRLTQAMLAAALATSQQNVSRWQTGAIRPIALFRRKIAVLYKIPERNWLTDNEVAFLSARSPSRLSTTVDTSHRERSAAARGTEASRETTHAAGSAR